MSGQFQTSFFISTGAANKIGVATHWPVTSTLETIAMGIASLANNLDAQRNGDDERIFSWHQLDRDGKHFWRALARAMCDAMGDLMRKRDKVSGDELSGAALNAMHRHLVEGYQAQGWSHGEEHDADAMTTPTLAPLREVPPDKLNRMIRVSVYAMDVFLYHLRGERTGQC